VTSREGDWIARLRAPAGRSIDELLKSPLALDVWQRESDAVVVAASDETLKELERRRLAVVDRLHTVKEYLARAREFSRRADSSHGRKPLKF
jgi:hypothetical protein